MSLPPNKFLFLLFSIILFSCTTESSGISIFIEEGTEEAFQNLLVQNPADFPYILKSFSGPVPEEVYTLADNKQSFLIIHKENLWKDDQAGKPSPTLPGSRHKIITQVYLAPVTDFTDLRISLPKKDIDAERILPVREIQLPFKALSVDNLYPGDTGYPLVERIILTLNLQAAKNGKNETRKALDNLEEWFQDTERLGEDYQAGDSSVLWIGAVGDILPARGAERFLLGKEDRGLDKLFQDTLPILRSQDLLLGNLEGPVSRRGARIDKTYTFRFIPEVLPGLKNAGFDYLSITNNHCFDYGITAFLDTLGYLSGSGIGTSGAGRDLREASLPWEAERKGERIRVLSLGAYPVERSGFDGKRDATAGPEKPGILWQGEETLEAVAAAFSEENCFTIVMVHGGEEWRNEPTTDQVQLYRSLLEAGADLVLGSHPHVLQGLEVFNKKLIAYSLGNFIFPGMEETRYGEESVILSLGVLEGAIRYINLYPVRISGITVSLDLSDKILQRFNDLTITLKKGGL